MWEIDLASSRLALNLTEQQLARRLPSGFAGCLFHRQIIGPFNFSLDT
jgi:hypothetical protein